MAEERNLAVARAEESDEVDSTKAELQRRMEEARESITQTVTEIKDTVANQYQSVKDTVTEALDWREQYRKRPVAFSIGALSAGFILGYSVAGTFKGDGSEYEEDEYPAYDESDAFSTTGAAPQKLSASSYEAENRALRRPASYSAPSRGAQAVASGAHGSTQYEQAAPMPADYGTAEEEEADKPGLIERFKETRAYDKLQEEVGVLGDRFIEELSSVGRNVVLPALFSKVKELFGVDLSNKQQASSAQSAGARGASSSSGQAGTGSASGASASTGASAAGGGARGGGSSYAASENRDYTASSPDRT